MPPIPRNALIRNARPDEASTISALAHQTFRETYASQTRTEDMNAFLADAYRPADIAKALRDPRHRWFIAESEGSVAGFVHLLVGERHASVLGERPVLLAEIYLKASHQGVGLGAAMMQQAIETARLTGDVLWLGVWEHNARAIEFYRRWGFRPVGDTPFSFASEQQRDIVMALSLRAAEGASSAM
jgi:diamine N-acetyltransferase